MDVRGCYCALAACEMLGLDKQVGRIAGQLWLCVGRSLAQVAGRAGNECLGCRCRLYLLQAIAEACDMVDFIRRCQVGRATRLRLTLVFLGHDVSLSLHVRGVACAPAVCRRRQCRQLTSRDHHISGAACSRTRAASAASPGTRRTAAIRSVAWPPLRCSARCAWAWAGGN